jgi:predicted O-methyltransferase YrrM
MTTSKTSDSRWDAVDDYLTSLFVSNDPTLEAAVESSKKAGLPAIQVSPPQGKLLHLLARALGARNILEVGTLGGYSTIWLARALPADGQLITLELDPKHALVARSNIERAGLAATVEVRVGKAIETLPLLAGTVFDLIFIDADKPSYPQYLVWALKLSRPGTVIIADNVVRDGEILNAGSEDAAIQAMRRFNEMLASEPRLSATAVQTVGCKGYDGFAFALVSHA